MRYIAYRFPDDSIGLFKLLEEHTPYGYMLVELIDFNYPTEIPNPGDNYYIICNSLEEVIEIKQKVEKSIKIIKHQQAIADEIFNKNK